MTKIKNGTILTYIDTDKKETKVLFAEIKLCTYLENLLTHLKLDDIFLIEPIRPVRKGQLTKSLSQEIETICFDKSQKGGYTIMVNNSPITVKNIKQNLFTQACLNTTKYFLKK